MSEQKTEEIKNNEECSTDLKGQSLHRDILSWGGRDRAPKTEALPLKHKVWSMHWPPGRSASIFYSAQQAWQFSKR